MTEYQYPRTDPFTTGKDSLVGYPASFIDAKDAYPKTLPHEMGHILGLPDENYDSNLLMNNESKGTQLDSLDIEIMRQSRFLH
jgi:hypothetical protein